MADANEAVKTLAREIASTIKNQIQAYNNIDISKRLDNLKISGNQIKPNTIEGIQLVDGSISTAKVRDFQADVARIADAEISIAVIDTAQIADAAITSAKIADAAINTAKINDAAITSAKIANAAITTALIDTGAVSTAQIADGSITDAKIVGLTANKITAGTLDAGTIDVINLKAANITVGKINGQQIANGAVALVNLASGVQTEIGKIGGMEEDIAELQREVESSIETFFYPYVPTLNNIPASQWTTEELKLQHQGDLFFDTQNNHSYRFLKLDGVWQWKIIEDGEVTQLMARVNQLENNMDTVEADLEQVASDISDIEGSVETIETDVNGLKTRMTQAEADIDEKADSSTVQSIQSTVSEHTQSINEIGERVTQAELDIETKADSSTVSTLSNTVASHTVSIGNIESRVEEDERIIETKADGQAVTQLTQRVTVVEQTADGLSSSVTALSNRVTADETTLSEHASLIQQNADAIETKVSETDFTGNTIASKINQTATTVQIEAQHINLVGAVTADDLTAGAVTADKIASNSISTQHITSNAITTDKIVSGAITTAKIASEAITANEIASNAITSDKIMANAITTEKLDAYSVTLQKLASDVGAGLDISSNRYIKIAVRDAGFGRTFISEAEPTEEDIQEGDLWIKPSGATWEQLEEFTWEELEDKTWGDLLDKVITYTYVDGEWVEQSNTQKVADNYAEIQLAQDRITQEVQRATTAEGGKIDKTTQYQTAQSIVDVAKSYTDGELTNYSTISQTSQAISAEVTKIENGTTPVGKVSTTSVLINSDGVQIKTGGTFTVASGNFGITDDGDVYMTGEVEATSGSIGGWNISNGNLYSGSGTSYVRLNGSNSETYAMWAGSESASTAPFRVGRNGSLFASNVDIEGEVTATSGSIGGWVIGSDKISTGTGASHVELIGGSGTYAIFAGASTASAAPFSVTKAGKLHASDADISGTITSTSGTIGGWTIDSNSLHSGTGANYVAITTSGDYALWSGASTASSAPFRVGRDGSVYITDLKVKNEQGEYESVDLSNSDSSSSYPLWKLNYATVRNISVTGNTLTIQTTSQTINFNKATSSSLIAEGGGGSPNFTVKAVHYEGSPTPVVDDSGIVSGQLSNAPYTSNTYVSLMFEGSVYGQVNVGAVYTKGYSDGEGSVTVSGVWSGLTYTATASNGEHVLTTVSNVEQRGVITYNPTTHNSTISVGFYTGDGVDHSAPFSVSGANAYNDGVTAGEGHFTPVSLTLQGSQYLSTATYYTSGTPVTYYQGSTGTYYQASTTLYKAGTKATYYKGSTGSYYSAATTLYKAGTETTYYQGSTGSYYSAATTLYKAGTAATYYNGDGAYVVGRGTAHTITYSDIGKTYYPGNGTAGYLRGSTVSVTPIGDEGTKLTVNTRGDSVKVTPIGSEGTKLTVNTRGDSIDVTPIGDEGTKLTVNTRGDSVTVTPVGNAVTRYSANPSSVNLYEPGSTSSSYYRKNT